jgi:hypothetical protein
MHLIEEVPNRRQSLVTGSDRGRDLGQAQARRADREPTGRERSPLCGSGRADP